MTALGDFSAGDVLTAADLNAIGTWTSYTPTTTNFTATFNDTEYLQINDWVHFRGAVGLTSNPTAGMYISVPVAASEPTFNWTRYSSTVGAHDASTGTWYPGNYVSFSDANTITFANAAITSQFNATVPFTWTAADGDFIQFSMIYRAA